MADIDTAVEEIASSLMPVVGPPELHKYPLVVPEYLFDKYQSVAEYHHTTVVDLIRRAMKLFLLFAEIELEIEDDTGVELIVRRPGKEDQVYVFQV